ncbi:hypothetical protein SAMN04489765_3833 [Tsukamurella pulmonis]|uniref:Lipoprotein n=1 Tax=Tsukamurella pulmonis TaxID=47312 RepID=A0A1H1H5P8_9ACTN|nr:hypothetical protein SAMN04489765_3833 [Tsukamurella pulmonis]SUP15894.1 Uncharacterised protein [Tsukamurella pulmonis]
MKLLTRLACGAALFSVVAVTSCSLPPERPAAAGGPTSSTSTRTIYCPSPGEGNPSDLCQAHAAGVGLDTPHQRVHVVTCPPSGSGSAPAGCLSHESAVPIPAGAGTYGTPVPAGPR